MKIPIHCKSNVVKLQATLRGRHIADDLKHNSDEVQGQLHRPAVMICLGLRPFAKIYGKPNTIASERGGNRKSALHDRRDSHLLELCNCDEVEDRLHQQNGQFWT